MTFRDSTIVLYTKGACHLLVRALLEMRPDFKAGVILESLATPHAFVVMPDGKALDIQGVQTIEEIQRKWEACADTLVYSYAEFRKEVPERGLSGWGTPSEWGLTRSRVRKTAQKLLASIEGN